MTIIEALAVPKSVLQTAIQLANKFVKRGVSGLRKAFNNEGPDGPFIPVTYKKLKDLNIEAKYQRLINTNFIKNAKEFKPALVKPLSVFLRPNGDYVVVDGQHTCVLAATYVEDPDNFELPCQVQVHPADFTIEQCLEAEAKYFTDFNSSRTNMSAVALLRSDLAQGRKYAVRMEENFKKLGVHVELIGADDNGKNGVSGYRGLKDAIAKYGIEHTFDAIELYRRLISNKEFKTWKSLDGCVILGFTALFHFINTKSGLDKKGTDLLDYIETYLCITETPKTLTTKTAGVIQDILIVERILDKYKSVCPVLGYAKIGTTEKDSVFVEWKNHDVHNKAKITT